MTNPLDPRMLHEQNRVAWNEGAVGYDAVIGDRALLPTGGSTLKPIEQARLGDLHGWCQRAIHLQCASGADTLSLINHGAAEAIGIDIADVHIANARRKAAEWGFAASFICCDLLDTPHELDGTADLVYTGKGALNWLHDLDGWAAVVARLLRPGGRVFLYEPHPILWVFREEAPRYEVHPDWSYFRTSPEVSQGWGAAYLGNLGKRPHELARKYERLWPVSVVITALVSAGLRLERFEELPDSPFSFSLFPNIPPDQAAVLPQSYLLQLTRPA